MRVLVTGARDWDKPGEVRAALHTYWLVEQAAGHTLIVVHGDARGVDWTAELWGTGRRGVTMERHPSRDFDSPRDRNQHMVNLGANVTLCFALRWDSGSGQTARMARRVGIDVRDYGVDTRQEVKP